MKCWRQAPCAKIIQHEFEVPKCTRQNRYNISSMTNEKKDEALQLASNLLKYFILNNAQVDYPSIF